MTYLETNMSPNVEKNMISVTDAELLVKEHALNLSSEFVSIDKLNGRVLSQDVFASREQPPFNRVTMDGIAISFSDSDKREYRLNGIQKAGTKALTLSSNNEAIEVMTGAVLPENCNCVIPYENCDLSSDIVVIKKNTPFLPGDNIHEFGSDYHKGDLLLSKGIVLNPPTIAIIASQGLSKIKVKSIPKVAIVSTGDELIEPGLACEPWQIWKSNPFGLESALNELGVSSDKITKFHLLDNEEHVYSQLKEIINTHEVIILSGGVSMGKYDFVHTVMSDLSAKTIFHKVKQKPGKPLLFAKGKEGQCIFGLPGNPVSALVCMRRYVFTSLEESFGLPSKKMYAKLSEEVIFKKEFSLFSAVHIESTRTGELIATPVKTNCSGDFSSLAHSEGFLELDENLQCYKKGSVFRYFPWKRI